MGAYIPGVRGSPLTAEILGQLIFTNVIVDKFTILVRFLVLLYK